MSKSVSASANANLDVNQLLDFLVKAGDTSVNDLGVMVDNQTKSPYKVDMEVLHGNFNSFDGISDLKPFKEGDNRMDHIYEMAFRGVGAYGVKIILTITNVKTKEKYYAMVGTPPGKKTYIRWRANDKNGLKKVPKHRSSQGEAVAKYKKVDFRITLTNSSPSVCLIMILPK